MKKFWVNLINGLSIVFLDNQSKEYNANADLFSLAFAVWKCDGKTLPKSFRFDSTIQAIIESSHYKNN